MECENCGEEIIKDGRFKTGYAHINGYYRNRQTQFKFCDKPLPTQSMKEMR